MEIIPDRNQIIQIIGSDNTNKWEIICRFIKDNYAVNISWKEAGNYGKWEQKIKIKEKTFCTFYFRNNELIILIILGKKERDIVEQELCIFSNDLMLQYNNAKTYHDGKWIFFSFTSNLLTDDIVRFLQLKKKPKAKINGNK